MMTEFTRMFEFTRPFSIILTHFCIAGSQIGVDKFFHFQEVASKSFPARILLAIQW